MGILEIGQKRFGKNTRVDSLAFMIRSHDKVYFESSLIWNHEFRSR